MIDKKGLAHKQPKKDDMVFLELWFEAGRHSFSVWAAPVIQKKRRGGTPQKKNKTRKDSPTAMKLWSFQHALPSPATVMVTALTFGIGVSAGPSISGWPRLRRRPRGSTERSCRTLPCPASWGCQPGGTSPPDGNPSPKATGRRQRHRCVATWKVGKGWLQEM